MAFAHKEAVVLAWLEGVPAKASAFSTDGVGIYSYNLLLGKHDGKGNNVRVIDKPNSSVTTIGHYNALIESLLQNGVKYKKLRSR